MIHVGISARTEVAVHAIYLDCLRAGEILPLTIRSDRGSETPILAAVHWRLHGALRGVEVPFETVY